MVISNLIHDSIKFFCHYFFLLLLSAFTFSNASLASDLNQSKVFFSKYFYGNSAGKKECLRGPLPPHSFSLKPEEESIRLIASVIGFDWENEHRKNSSSLSVKHEKISFPVRELFAISQQAVAKKDEELKKEVKNLLKKIAKSDTLLATPSLKEVKSKGGRCYDGNNNVKAVCKFHVTQFAMQFGANYIVAASLLKDEMSDEDYKIIGNYIDKMHKKFSAPIFQQLNKQKKEFSQMANGGLSVLAYAHWKDNKILAAKTFEKIFQNIDRVFMDDGYIKGTSFRGVRGFWYHSYGTNSALSVIALADLWKVRVPKKVRDKVTNATKLLNVGIKDIKVFYARKDPDGKQKNASYNEVHARHHMHQMAIGIAHLAAIAVDVDVNIEDDYEYKRKTPTEYPSDFTVGFNSNCMSK